MRWVVAVGAGVIALAVTGGLLWYATGGKPAAKSGGVAVERVSSTGVTAKGTVEPITTQSLSFAVSGTVTAVNVKPGDAVTVGEVLARIDQADAKQAVADATSALADAQAALDAAWASASASPSATTCTSSGTGGSSGHTSSASPSPSARASSSPSASNASATSTASTTQVSTALAGNTTVTRRRR
jgi:HlyD family secretion protein